MVKRKTAVATAVAALTPTLALVPPATGARQVTDAAVAVLMADARDREGIHPLHRRMGMSEDKSAEEVRRDPDRHHIHLHLDRVLRLRERSLLEREARRGASLIGSAGVEVAAAPDDHPPLLNWTLLYLVVADATGSAPPRTKVGAVRDIVATRYPGTVATGN